MKKLVALIFMLSCIAFEGYAQVKIGPFNDSGNVSFFFFPSHNEYDPNQGVFPFARRYVARYAVDMNTQFSLASFPKLYVSGDLLSLFGDTRPQTEYNYTATPIVGIYTLGVGYHLNHYIDTSLQTSMHKAYSSRYQGERLMWTAAVVDFHW